MHSKNKKPAERLRVSGPKILKSAVVLIMQSQVRIAADTLCA